jgi:hypothetical protein
MRLIIFFLILFLALGTMQCKKIVSIDPPTNSITKSQVFADSVDAATAIVGLYSRIMNTRNSISLLNGGLTIFCGISADELVSYTQNNIYINALQVSDPTIRSLWNQAYQYIYQANSCIEGLQASNSLSGIAKNQFIGEAKFLRSLCYFYLVNLFGDVPLITNSDFNANAKASRIPKSQIYQAITSDLKDAQTLLGNDYSYSGGERIRANKWAATALLARAYLYTGDWMNAETQASTVINNSSTFGLVNSLGGVFLANNSEAILQWQVNSAFSPYNATTEGYLLLPRVNTRLSYFISKQLLASFEPGDLRATAWVKQIPYSGKQYPVPYKYKIGIAQAVINTTPTEYYMVLRLAEQYLIRAEARAQLGEANAIDDLNMIRTRAGLPVYAGSSNKDSVLSRIYHERRVELFAEWGHRWLDLKRTGQIDVTMDTVTPKKTGGGPWKSYQQLYPIPLFELETDPNLTENQGY